MTRQGRPRQPLPIYHRAWKIAEAALGPDHPEVASIVYNIAVLHHVKGEYAEAERLYRRAQESLERVRGPRHSAVARVLQERGQLRLARGDARAALGDFQRALSLSEPVLRQFLVEARMARYLDTIRDDEQIDYSFAARHGSNAGVARLALAAALSRKGRTADAGAQTIRAIQRSLKTPEDQARFSRLRNLWAATPRSANNPPPIPAPIAATPCHPCDAGGSKSKSSAGNHIALRRAEWNRHCRTAS